MDASMIYALFEVIAPVVLMVLIGYCLQRFSDSIDTASMSSLVMQVGTPALVFSTLTTTDLPTDVLMQVSLGALCACALASALAGVILKLLGYSFRSFLPPLTMPNSGNLGLPVVLLAFGDDGLAIGVSFFFVIAIIQYTVMPVVVAGAFSIRKLLTEPLIWAVLAALFIKFTATSVPTVIGNTAEILGGMMIPTMIILLGAAIAQLGVSDLKTACTLALVRLVVGLVAGAGTVLLLGMSGPAAGALFLLAAMPSAVITYVIAQRYGREPEKVAGLVVVSTVLTLLILPLLLWTALQIAA